MADEIDKVIDELKRQGFAIERSGSSHYRVRPPDPARPVVTLARSKEWRALANTLRDLRKVGFVWPPPPKAKKDAGGVSAKDEACCLECYGPSDSRCTNKDCECHEEVAPKTPTPLALPAPPPKTDVDSLHLAVVEARAALRTSREYVAVCTRDLAKAKADHEASLLDEKTARERFEAAKKRYDEAMAEDLGEVAS